MFPNKGKLALTFNVLTREGSEFLLEETSEDSNCRKKRMLILIFSAIAKKMQKRETLHFLAILSFYK